MLNCIKRFSKTKHYIPYLGYLIISLFFIHYFALKNKMNVDYSYYFLMLASLYGYAIHRCLFFLKRPLKPWHDYCLFISVFFSGFLSTTYLIYLFQILGLLIFMDTLKYPKSVLSVLGLLFLSLAVESYQFFGLCQWEQIITLIDFGQSGLLTGDIYTSLSQFLGILILPLWLICFFKIVEEMRKHFLRTTLSLSTIFVMVLSCYLIFYITGIYQFLQSLMVIYQHLQPFLMCLGFFLIAFAWFFKRSSRKIISICLFLAGVLAIEGEYQLIDYVYQRAKLADNTIDYFLRDYKNPANVNFHIPQQPKNLVLIYVESLESSYQNKKLFKRDLLSSLNQLELPKLSFHHFSQVPNTGWTMAGIIASQCGIPYKSSTAYVGNALGEHLKTFLPHAWCLGDVLNQYGYKNIFLNGSSLDFAGQGLFFKTHHYDELYGKREWQQQGYKAQDLKFWGLADDDLFIEAKRTLNRLMRSQNPFNLTILTIDTHGMDGRLSKTCLKKGGHNFEDVVECSSAEVANFIHYVADKGWLDRVTIVVTGDHLVMGNAVSDRLSQVQNHYIYNLLISDRQLQKSRDNIVHFDLYPSILKALGFNWDDDKLGLGYSALGVKKSELNVKTRLARLKKTILSNSQAYKKLW